MTAVGLPMTHSEKPGAIAFCATGKSGLGHLRRVTNVASAVKQLSPDTRLDLYSNAEVAGLAFDERQNFASTVVVPRDQIADTASGGHTNLIVVDTAVLRGLHQAANPLCLLLRETVPERLRQFKLGNGRKWDLVCVPNPKCHWMPDPEDIGAERIEATGWIFRKAAIPKSITRDTCTTDLRKILVCSGGGGTRETAAYMKQETDEIIGLLRRQLSFPIEITQIAGPRMPIEASLESADHVIEVGGNLNDFFARFDLVMSTAGYNSILELAQLDVPVVMIPICRSLDDQVSRARTWAPSLGFMHVQNNSAATAHWMSSILHDWQRRKACSLDNDGAERCARLLLEYLP